LINSRAFSDQDNVDVDIGGVLCYKGLYKLYYTEISPKTLYDEKKFQSKVVLPLTS